MEDRRMLRDYRAHRFRIIRHRAGVVGPMMKRLPANPHLAYQRSMRRHWVALWVIVGICTTIIVWVTL